jgi:hypothetical protein
MLASVAPFFPVGFFFPEPLFSPVARPPSGQKGKGPFQKEKEKIVVGRLIVFFVSQELQK